MQGNVRVSRSLEKLPPLLHHLHILQWIQYLTIYQTTCRERCTLHSVQECICNNLKIFCTIFICSCILHHLQPVHHLHNYTFFSATMRSICKRTFENALIFGKLFGVRHFPFTPSHETCDDVFLQCDLGRPCQHPILR